MKRIFLFAIVLAGGMLLLNFSIARAIERGDLVVSGGPVFTPILGGDISDTSGAPGYDDIFKNGWGIGLDGMFYLRSWIRVGGGFSVSVFPGDDFDGEDVGKWWVAPMMVGAQFFPLGSKEKSPRPYLRLDAGGNFFGAVKVDNPAGGMDLGLFRTSAAFAGDAGGGVEYRFGSHWGIFGEVRYMIIGHPIGGGDIEIHNPDAVSFLPIRAGLTYTY